MEKNDAFEEMRPDKLRCRRCHGPVEWSPLHDYSYYCPECDEDLYSFEVERADEKNRRHADR